MRDKKRDQFISLAGVVALAIVLPGILKITNSVARFLVGAEGRLAAISVENNRVLGPMPEPWKGLAQGADELKTFLDGTIPNVSEIKLNYIRIDHIFDEFNIVSRQNDGLIFNWSELDNLVGKIEQTGAQPFFVLSYMPLSISSGDIVSAPSDWSEWTLVVQKTIEHYSGELGMEGLYYEVWNEPDLFGEWKINGKKDYKQLYLNASRGAEKARNVKAFKLGGPATTGLYKNWLDGFFPFILENKLRLDFFSWHRYDLDINKYISDVEEVDLWIDKHPYFAEVEKIVTEFGPKSDQGGENNTRVGAAHLVAVMREFMAKVKIGFGFAVKGSWGILDTPRYEALKMLSRLGNQRLAVAGEGTWVKAIAGRKDDATQVILANYDPKGIHSEVVPVTFMNLRDNKFTLRKTYLGGAEVEELVATTEAILQREIPLTPNSVVLLELKPVETP